MSCVPLFIREKYPRCYSNHITDSLEVRTLRSCVSVRKDGGVQHLAMVSCIIDLPRFVLQQKKLSFSLLVLSLLVATGFAGKTKKTATNDARGCYIIRPKAKKDKFVLLPLCERRKNIYVCVCINTGATNVEHLEDRNRQRMFFVIQATT